MAFLSSFYPQPVVAGTTEGTFAEGDDPRIVGAIQSGGAAGGGLSGTYPNPTLAPVLASGSNTARTLSDRFAEVINVKDYGAVGDGVTSDSAAIQAAFNACPVGGCLYFPPTTNGYRITTTVNLWQASGVANRKKNITLLGHNTKLVRIQPPPPKVNITGDETDDVITAIGHTFSNGDKIVFSLLVGGSGLSINTTYYVINVNGDTFQVSTSSGGSVQGFTTEITSGTAVLLNVTGDASTNTFTCVGHQFVEGQHVQFRNLTGGLGSGSSLGEAPSSWYVQQVNGDTFKVSINTPDPVNPTPAIVNFTPNIASGTVYATDYPLFRINNTEGLCFEGLHFDGGYAFNPYAKDTLIFHGNAYRAMLEFGNRRIGYLPNEKCDNIKIVNCSFTNTQSQAIGYRPDVFATVQSGNESTDTITANAHGFSNGDKIRFASIVGGNGLNTTTTYYAKIIDGNSFQVLASPEDLNAIDFTSAIPPSTPPANSGFVYKLDVDNKIAWQGDNFVINNCYFNNCESAVVGNANFPRRASITNCHMIDGAFRQYIDPSGWYAVAGNTNQQFFGTISTPGVAIAIIGSIRWLPPTPDPFYDTSAQWTISNNVISNWGIQGMEISTPHSCAISGNVIQQTAYGISVVATSRSVSVSGNVFRGNMTYDLEWMVSGGAITGNIFDGRAIVGPSEGQSLCDSAITIRGQREMFIRQPEFSNYDNLGTVISGNSFTSYNTRTIDLQFADNTIISGNNIHSRVGLGIYAKNCSDVIINGNSLTQNNVDLVGRQAHPSSIMLECSPKYFAATGISLNGSTVTVTVNPANVANRHNFVNGQAVVMANVDQPEYNGIFYVSNVTALTFDYTISGSPAAPTGSNINATRASFTEKELTATASNDRILKNLNNFANGDAIVFTKLVGGSGLTQNTQVYYVVGASVNWFSVSTTIGGSIVDITGDYSDVEVSFFETDKRITISENTFNGKWTQSCIQIFNDAGGSAFRRGDCDNIRIVGNHASKLPAGGLLITNLGNGLFRNIYVRENTGGLASSNTSHMRVNQNNVKTASPHSGAPNWIPRWVGDMYYDSGPKILYTAIGTASSSDWKALATWNP